MDSFFLYPILGVVAGVLAGLLGIGGGLIIVPALLFIWSASTEIPEPFIIHVAIGTSLAVIIFTSLAATLGHQRKAAVQWQIVRMLAPGMMLGAYLGAQLAHLMPGELLRTCFGIFALFAAVQMNLSYEPSSARTLPHWSGLLLVGSVIGFISAIVGIGGGTMTVPFLQWCKISIRQAIASSAACGFPIALAGVGGYILAQPVSVTAPGLTGYIYFPAVLSISAGSLLGTAMGVRLVHKLPTVILLRVFSVLLIAVGLHFIFF